MSCFELAVDLLIYEEGAKIGFMTYQDCRTTRANIVLSFLYFENIAYYPCVYQYGQSKSQEAFEFEKHLKFASEADHP